MKSIFHSLIPFFLYFHISNCKQYNSFSEPLEKLILAEQIGCYSIVNVQLVNGNSHYFDDNQSLEKSCSINPACCNVVVIQVTTPINNQSMSLSFFRKYIIITPYSNLRTLTYDAVNVLVLSFHNHHYSILQKTDNVWQVKRVWNGTHWVELNKKYLQSKPQLRVAAFMMPPYSEIWTTPDGNQWTGQGLEMSFLKEVAVHDQFDIKWIDVLYEEGGLWGGILPNGSTSGQAKVLYEHRADVGIGEIFCGFKFDYFNKQSCSWSYDFDGLLTLIQEPKQHDNWLGIVTPYTSMTWGCISLSLIAATLVIMFYNMVFGRRIDITMHFLDALNPMAGRPMSQPGFQAKRIKETSTQYGYSVFLLLYILGCMIINQGYECNLKSHLTTIIPPDPINSFEELAEFPFKELIFVNPASVANLNAMLRPSSDIGRNGLQQLGTKKLVIPPPQYIKVFTDVYLEVTKGHAVISSRSAIEYEIRRQLTNDDGSTNVQIVPEYFAGYPVALIYTRMNIFESHLNRRLSQWSEAGFFIHWLKKEWRRAASGKEIRNAGAKSSFAPLELQSFYLVFTLLGILLLSAFFAFCFELYMA